jgi:hypothetical protein
MAAKKKAAPKKAAGRKGAGGGDSMIVSKSRTKAAVKRCNVAGDFYGGLEAAVRELIAKAEERALANKRKTVRATDV